MMAAKQGNCCADTANHSHYRASTPSGLATCCKKCGRAWVADTATAASANHEVE